MKFSKFYKIILINNYIASRVAPNYSTLYTTSHKASCRVAVYSQDGNFKI